MKKTYLYIVVLLIIIIGASSCKNIRNSGKSSNVHLTAAASHSSVDNEDINEFYLSIVLANPILAREITLKIGGREWEVENPSINTIIAGPFEDKTSMETVLVFFKNESLLGMDEPQLSDYQKAYGYGYDWGAYEAAKSKYMQKYEKVHTRMLKDFISSLKMRSTVSYEIKGKIKNVSGTIPKEDIERVLDVWDVYQQM